MIHLVFESVVYFGVYFCVCYSEQFEVSVSIFRESIFVKLTRTSPGTDLGDDHKTSLMAYLW